MPRVDVSMTPEEIADLLAAPRNAVLTTMGPDGYPHSTAMWFAVEDGEVRMWTYGKSQKARNVRRDPKVAFLVEEGLAYSELKGILVRGDARIVEGFEAVAAIGRALYDRYTLPRTGVPVEEGPIVEIERQARKRVGIVLSLDRLASWDHRKLS